MLSEGYLLNSNWSLKYVHFSFNAFFLTHCRAGGDWTTTYAPSPFYMTSKMKSLYLEGYDYSIFDLTRDDRVQIQVLHLVLGNNN